MEIIRTRREEPREQQVDVFLQDSSQAFIEGQNPLSITDDEDEDPLVLPVMPPLWSWIQQHHSVPNPQQWSGRLPIVVVCLLSFATIFIFSTFIHAFSSKIIGLHVLVNNRNSLDLTSVDESPDQVRTVRTTRLGTRSERLATGLATSEHNEESQNPSQQEPMLLGPLAKSPNELARTQSAWFPLSKSSRHQHLKDEIEYLMRERTQGDENFLRRKENEEHVKLLFDNRRLPSVESSRHLRKEEQNPNHHYHHQPRPHHDQDHKELGELRQLVLQQNGAASVVSNSEPESLVEQNHIHEVYSYESRDTNQQNTHVTDMRESAAREKPAEEIIGNITSNDQSNGSTKKTFAFPRTLNKVYDGKWKSVSGETPFSNLPPFSSLAQGDHLFLDPRSTIYNLQNAFKSERERASSPSNLQEVLSKQLRSDDSRVRTEQENVYFRNSDGFALLTVESREFALTPGVNIVLGELLLRDGIYRSSRDISIRIIGLYEWQAGQLSVVGDAVNDIHAAAKLYSVFVSDAATGREREADLFAHNISSTSFIQLLNVLLMDYRRQFRGFRRRGSNEMESSGKIDLTYFCSYTGYFQVYPAEYPGSRPPPPIRYPMDYKFRMRNSSSSYDPSFLEMLEDGNKNGADAKARYPARIRGKHASFFMSQDDPQGGFQPVRMRPASGFRGRRGLTDMAVQDVFVKLHGSVISENCQTQISVQVSTLDTERLFSKATNYTLMVTFASFLQVLFLVRQMEMTSTQASANKVSLLTVGLQAVADSYLCLCHLTLGIAVQSLFNAFATAAFFKFVLFSIFEMRYMLIIWKARRPNAFSEGWDTMRRELSLLYSRFYGSLLFGVLLLYQMRDHLYLFVFCFYSFWIPQIILNVVEDHRRPLHLTYLFGMSFARSWIPLYFLACPVNFLHIQPYSGLAFWFAIYVAAQTLILYSQHVWGSRWFIPSRFLPEKYDYFRAIPRNLLHDSSGGTADSSDLESGSNNIECCICMQNVYRRNQMLAPCNHVFHEDCLLSWMNEKMLCPLCRQVLPPP